MNRRKNFLISLGIVIAVISLSIGGCKKKPEHPTGQSRELQEEHPTRISDEHPEKEHPAKEHPNDHPKKQAKVAVKTTTIDKEGLADAVESYVRKEAVKQGGYFVALDEKTGKKLKLTLDKVHRKRLSKVGKDLYFACADFKTPVGKVYDLDVFMTGKNKNNLTFSEFTIHKEAGKERYTWFEEEGIWKKKDLDKPVIEDPKEHPEHPKK